MQARAVIRERLYALQLLLRGQITKHHELVAPLIGQRDGDDDALRRDLAVVAAAPAACSDGDSACGCGHGPATDDPREVG